MAIDTNGIWSSNNNSRRPGFTSIKFRLREERKKVIRISSSKYHNIDDHEIGLRRFCLIRNNLRRLQREAREEKLARHRTGANISPSYLSASRPRSPSPPCDMHVADVLSAYGQLTPFPISALSDDEDDVPPSKRPRLFVDDDKENDKENSCDDPLIDVVGDKEEPCSMDDTQEILREVYESYTGECLSQSRPSPPALPIQPDNSCSTLSNCSNNMCKNMSSINSTLPSNLSCGNLNRCSNSFSNTGCLGLSERMEWSRPQQRQYPCERQYPCGHSALRGNDLQSVVFHSLIASLES